jgi:hypothetical protein
MSATLVDVYRVYKGSDGDATLALYKRLEALGSPGVLAVNLFRAQKNSERAKAYRGRGYKGAAYDRKQWSIDNLCKVLAADAEPFGIAWGWGHDPKQPVHCWVLYVELPTGQVSFHTEARGAGPDHAEPWDGVPGQGPDRICRWVTRLLDQAAEP